MRIALLCLLGCASPAPPHVTPPPVAITVDAAPAVAADAPVVEDEVLDVAPPKLAVLQQLPGIAIVQSFNFGEHGHGGPPAEIDDVSITVDVEDRRSHAISAERVELLSASCRETTWRDRKPLTITGYRLYDWNHTDPIAQSPTRIAMPAVPARYSIQIAIAAIHVYQACDRFAFAVQLIVDGGRVALELPLDVKRLEPMRHKH